MSIPKSPKGLASGQVSSASELASNFVIIITPFTFFFLYIKLHLFILTGYFRLEILAPEGFIWALTTAPKMQIIFSALLWDSMMLRGQWLFKALYNNVINGVNGIWLP